ncbi:SDR family NAD(P)-dependent oxidoreductase [Marinihelvus fidelis]|nr:SDR family NAD(P)-dependent oxidoreductase [Marinihelvus fidelis]
MSNSKHVKTVLITGAAGGLGRSLALACAKQGMQLVVLDKDRRGLAGLCDEIECSGAPAPGVCEYDLVALGPDQCDELVSGIVEAYGQLDGLVHCATRFDGLQPLDQVAGDAWLGHMQVNLNAPWLLTRTALPALRDQGGAVVFAINDDAARGKAYWGPYGTSQSALQTMVTMLFEECEGTPCRVYGINPGPMRTGVRAKAFHTEDPSSVPSPDRAAGKFLDAVLGKCAAGPALQLD